MNNVSNEIVQEAITTENPDIVGMSITLDAEDEEDINRMNDIDHKSVYNLYCSFTKAKAIINQCKYQ